MTSTAWEENGNNEWGDVDSVTSQLLFRARFLRVDSILMPQIFFNQCRSASSHIVYNLFQYPWCWMLIHLNGTTLIILIIISYTWNCDPSPLHMPTCGRIFHYIFLFIESSPPILLLYLWYMRHLLRRASARKESPAALA